VVNTDFDQLSAEIVMQPRLTYKWPLKELSVNVPVLVW